MHYRFGPYRFDARNVQLEGLQGVIALRPMTLKLLHALLESAPDLIAHDDLLDRVWGRQAVTAGVLSQSIRELRRALGETAQAPVYIETRHKIGYRFAGPLQRIDTEAADAAVDAPPDATTTDAEAKASPRSPWLALVAMIGALALLVGLLLWREARPPVSAQEQSVEIVHDGRPREPEALRWYREGLDALAAHDPVRAQERFELALDREPTAIATLAGLAQALAERGEARRALELAQPLRDGAAALPREAQLHIAAFLARLEQRHDDALRQLTALSALNPGDTDAGLRLAALQIETGDTAAAEATLARLAMLPRVDPARLALLRARIAGIRGDQPARLAAAGEAADAPTDTALHAEALLEQGHALLLSGDIDGATAIRDALTALPALPHWPAISLRTDLFAATLRRDAGELAEAIELFRRCAESAHRHGLPALATAARREAAHVQFLAGRYDQAIAELQAVEQEQAALGDPRALASTLDIAALAQQRHGDPDAAQQLAQRALTIYRDSGDAGGEASARNTLGMLYSRSGRHPEAQQQWEAALDLFERIGNRRGVATVRSNLAIAHGHAGRPAAAREANEAALAIFRELGATADVARLQFNLGIQDRRAGELAAAEQRLGEALQGFTELGTESFRLQAIASLAELRLLRADPEGAQALLADLDPAQLAPPERAAAIASAQARLALLRADMESARAGFEQARQLRESAGLTDWMRFSELDLAELAAVEGQWLHAEQRVRELRRDMARHGDPRAALQAGILLAAILHVRGDLDAAARLLDTLDDDLAEHPDAVLAMRLDLVRAAQTPGDRNQALAHFAARAEAAGFDLLALRAGLLGNDANARQRLDQLGIRMEGMPPVLPY